MRYLGIDYGEKRAGIALSDDGGRMAFPYKTVSAAKKLMSVLKEIADRENVGAIVVGLPIPFSGGESAQTLKIKSFAARLEKEIGLPVEFENELFTTKLAERASPKEKADASAAAIILQSFLDKMNRSGAPAD